MLALLLLGTAAALGLGVAATLRVGLGPWTRVGVGLAIAQVLLLWIPFLFASVFDLDARTAGIAGITALTAAILVLALVRRGSGPTQVSPAQLVAGRGSLAHSRGKSGYLVAQIADRARFGPADHRHDQTLRSVDGESDVIAQMLDDLVSRDRGVEQREVREQRSNAMHEQRLERRLAEIFPRRKKTLGVDLPICRDMRNLAP